MRSFAKIKSSRKFPNLQYIFSPMLLSTVHVHIFNFLEMLSTFSDNSAKTNSLKKDPDGIRTHGLYGPLSSMLCV